jgi:hypothetical protein
VSLTYGLKTPRDMFEKLRREHARLKAQVTSDNLFNFVVTAYHIRDWVKKHPAATQAAKNNARSLYSNTYIGVCRDLTNASKHYVLFEDYRDQVTEKVSAISAYGSGRFGVGDFGSDEESIVVVLRNGTRMDALDLAQNVVDLWEQFFQKHRL